MTRFRLIAAACLIAIVVVTWAIYSLWPTPKKFPIAIPSKPAIHAEWPVIDCATKSIANAGLFAVPRTNSRFLLKIKLKNVPEPKKGFFLTFYPEKGTEDAKKNWYYGGAMIGEGIEKAGVWEFEGEASVCTYRDQRMRAVLERGEGEPDLAEVLVNVESENQN